MTGPLLALALAACAASAEPLPGLVVDETKPERAAFLREALAAMLESPAAREAAAEFAVAGPTVTLRWAPLESSALSFEGSRTVVTGLSAFTSYTDSGTVVSINERLISAAKPRELSQDLAHELLGHAAERARAEGAGVAYVYAVARDNETSASLLGWLVAAELGLPLNDASAFAFLDDPEAYYRWRLYEGTDYAAALTAAELPRAREVYRERAVLMRRRIEEWAAHAAGAARELEWLEHFEKDHGWPAAPFELVAAELRQQRDAERERNRQLLERTAAVLDDLTRALDESAADRKALASAARHPLMKRWAKQVRRRREALRAALAVSGQTEAAVQPRPSGQLTHAQVLAMIEADLKLHAADDGGAASLPPRP